MKVCYVISDVNASVLMDANIRALTERAELTTIFLAAEPPGLFKSLRDDGYSVKFMRCRGKLDLPVVCWKLRELFRRSAPDVVHTHLFNASITGLTAAKLAGIKRRVNTRHHSVEAHLYHPHAVWYDKYVNALSWRIIAITKIVADILVNTEKVPSEKVTVIHHGFDMKHFEKARSGGSDLREKYRIKEGKPVIGVISRFIHWKGVQYVIPAFKVMLQRFPKAILVLANAVGPYEREIKLLLRDLDPESYRVIDFEYDILQLYNSFDIFVHVPIGPQYEAFGQVYVEALAMGLPSVFTLSGIASDFIVDNQNAIVVPYENSEAIAGAILKLADDPGLGQRLAASGRRFVQGSFDVEKMVDNLLEVYSKYGTAK